MPVDLVGPDLADGLDLDPRRRKAAGKTVESESSMSHLSPKERAPAGEDQLGVKNAGARRVISQVRWRGLFCTRSFLTLCAYVDSDLSVTTALRIFCMISRSEVVSLEWCLPVHYRLNSPKA